MGCGDWSHNDCKSNYTCINRDSTNIWFASDAYWGAPVAASCFSCPALCRVSHSSHLTDT